MDLPPQNWLPIRVAVYLVRSEKRGEGVGRNSESLNSITFVEGVVAVAVAAAVEEFDEWLRWDTPPWRTY